MTDNRTSSYVASEMPMGLDKELERLRAQALISWKQEARNFGWWGLTDNMSVLEMGNGPGFITEQLARLVPNGKVTAVEIDPVLIEKARAYLQSTGLTNWEINEGNVMSTGLPDNSFDFVYARYLFQHLPDPAGAAKEALRVLKPGGTLVVTDVDDKLDVWDPISSPDAQALYDRIEKHYQQQQAGKGGNRFIGRRLPNILKSAGFDHVDMEVLMIHSSLTDLSGLVPKPTREEVQIHVDSGIVTAEEADLMYTDSLAFYEADYVIMLPLLMAYGQKPGG